MHITYNINICTFEILKPHEDTQTVGIFVGWGWWCRGVIESFSDLVLGCNNWMGWGIFK